jgi:hypothetical protein
MTTSGAPRATLPRSQLAARPGRLTHVHLTGGVDVLDHKGADGW